MPHPLPRALGQIRDYWPMATDTAVLVVAEAYIVAPIMRAIVDWDDLCEFIVVPAIRGEEGLELAKQMQGSPAAAD